MSTALKSVFYLCILLYFIVYTDVSHCNKREQYSEINNLVSDTPIHQQQQAAEELIARKLGKRAKDILVFIKPNLGQKNRNTFEILTDNSPNISIIGNNAISVVWGFHFYLTQYVGGHISWDGEWLNMPTKWPPVPQGNLSISSNDKFRYMENMCTFSYSYQWYDWPSWENHIDWMALNGINLPLAANGQEEIWRRVFMKFGFSSQDIEEYFTGAAFLSWNRMGNIRKWGGHIPLSWLKDQTSLQKMILNRMRSLSMLPIVPAFAGFVPEGIHRIYPRSKTHRLPTWNKFNETYSSNLLLDSEDPLFEEIGSEFLKEYLNEYGTNHLYSADTFNEMSSFGDTSFISSYGRAVFNAMQKVDENAIWVMQGWIFQDVLFWTQSRAKSLLTSVPLGRMIVLDLFAEEQPRFSLYKSFYGQPFIWCMLHNFGGKSSFYGVVDGVNEGPLAARRLNGSTMVGIGLAPEGIDQNYVMYEFMMEHSWITEPRDVDNWVAKYVARRYGTANINLVLAWRILMHSVYNFTQTTNRLRGPSFTSRPNLHLQPSYWYNPLSVFKAWDLFIEHAGSTHFHNSLFKHDLVDVTRQVMEIIIMKAYKSLIQDYHHNAKTDFMHSNHTLVTAMLDLDKLLGTCEKFLIGRWISNARKSTNDMKDEFEFNARNQLTSWGPDGNVLDYAAKQWSGLVKGYYLQRWKLFTKELYEEWEYFDQKSFNEKVMKGVELPFSHDTTLFPDKPIGDPIKSSILLYQRYRHHANVL